MRGSVAKCLDEEVTWLNPQILNGMFEEDQWLHFVCYEFTCKYLLFRFVKFIT